MHSAMERIREIKNDKWKDGFMRVVVERKEEREKEKKKKRKTDR